MDNKVFDVVVIGAGIQGAGVAQAAALQGASVLLLEQFATSAKGTSSKSSKLIHGGLRYLETAQFGLVKESLREKKILLKIAPAIVKPTDFIIPVYDSSRRSAFWVWLGLLGYRMLGETSPHQIDKIRWDQFPELKQEGLRAIFSYLDAQTDDAELTRLVLASAKKYGAEISFHTKVHGIDKTLEGFTLVDEKGIQYRARSIVNAAGPWVADIASKCHFTVPQVDCDLVQGAHLVLDVPAFNQCYYFESPEDSRPLFALPWQGHTLVGTTERLYQGDPGKCHISADEETYLKNAFSHYFPQHSHAAVIERFAGLRVLPKSHKTANARARETQIVHDRQLAKGYIAIYGGKLTVYRATAEKVIKQLMVELAWSEKYKSTEDVFL